MDETTKKKLDSLKKNLRSVLLSSKGGVAAGKLQGEYRALVGSFIPHKQFGANSLEEFIHSIPDVVQIRKNQENVLTYFAVADQSTQHIKAMISKQKSTKKSCSFQRNSFYSPRKYYGTAHTNYNKFRVFTPCYKGMISSPFQNFNVNVNNSHSRIVTYQKVRKITKLNLSEGKPSKKSIPKEFSDTRKVVFKTDNAGVWPNCSNIPPRFVDKQPAISVTKNLPPTISVNIDEDLYANPLSSIENTDQSDNKKGHKVEKIIDQKQRTNSSYISNEVQKNLRKLLAVNPQGIFANGLAELYKETFDLVLNDNILKQVIGGECGDFIQINTQGFGSMKKHILTLYEHNTSQQNQKSKYLIPSPQKVHLNKFSISSREPLSPGKQYKVKVVFVFGCDDISVHFQEDAVDFAQMTKMIKEHRKKIDTTPKIGSFVATSEGHRAKVMSCNGISCEVLDIDFGNLHSELIADLYYLEQRAANYTLFKVSCSLHRPSDKGLLWLKETKHNFEMRYFEEHLDMKVVSMSTTHSLDESSAQKYSVLFYQNTFNVNCRLLNEERELSISKQVIQSDPWKDQPTQLATLPSEEFCEFFVFNVSCATDVEVCVLGNGYSDDLVKLEEQMFEHYVKKHDRTSLPQPPPLGCIYAVLSENTCVRGRLLAIEENQGMVYLIDNGEQVSVGLSDLRILEKKFCNLPIQSISVALAGLDHSILATHSDILQKLHELVCNKPCVGRIVKRSNPESKSSLDYVELIKTNGDSDVNVNQLCAQVVMTENRLPAEPETVSVILSHFDDVHELVYVQIKGKCLTKLQSCLHMAQSSIKKQRITPAMLATDLYPGKTCLAIIGDQIYRAKIETIDGAKPRCISVFLIDVGRSANITRGCLLKMTHEELLFIPPQAICCQLSHVYQKENFFGCKEDCQFLKLNDIDDIYSQKFELLVIKLSVCEEPNVVSLCMTGDGGANICIIPNNKEDQLAQTITDELPPPLATSRQLGSTSCSDENTLDLTNEQDKDSYCELSDASSYDKLIKKYKSYVKDNKLKGLNDNTLNGHKLYYKDGCTMPGVLIPVIIDDSLSPNYIQMLPLSSISQREKLLVSMSIHYEQLFKMEEKINPIQGCMYALKYDFDKVGRNAWYRVTVQSKSQISNIASVYFVDYGHCDVIRGFSLFRKLHHQFDNIHPMSMTARLAGIKSVETEWSKMVCDRFCSFIKGMCYYAHVLKVTVDEALFDRTVYHVCLCDTSSNRDAWIDELLVDQWKCADYVA